MPLPIQPITDTGWKFDKATSSTRHRGISDHERIFTFDRELDSVEIDTLCRHLEECEAWGNPVRMHKSGPNTYKARTTQDSSD